MVKEQLEHFLIQQDYNKIPSSLPEFTIYFHMENNYVNVFHIIDYKNELYISEDQYIHLKKKIVELFHEKGIREVHILSLILSTDYEKARKLSKGDSMCWLIDPIEERLIVYENQISDFYGMKGKLEYWLDHISEFVPEKEKGDKREKRKAGNQPLITFFIVAVNIITYIICTFTGDLLYNKGAFSATHIIYDKEYYRILSSTFLHWDINHLVSNMLILFYLGKVVEKYFGHVKYAVIYLITGIFGNLLSMSYEIYTHDYVISVGASGAVFGVIGALLLLVLVHKGRWNQITLGRLVFMISYSLYSGFVSSNINNAAHIGGFLSGVGVAFLLWVLFSNKRMEKL
ncbi:rhomboid family intramembrane serine protease [Kineothrix sp. MB12-C1]|uniref:rhomboid family intramembrane serine protease n=1 Tax=Kineothrix sp. MB12-C1 TaxID=3070215 RepID=UPI0027D1FE1F|nr:rhomboid family intramembrane serine protease [Kineothrix sp. MB12-C1]WMC94339.1 rhomboid family intramembrane serine protease [Kineothrix sp. MB12-C1]